MNGGGRGGGGGGSIVGGGPGGPGMGGLFLSMAGLFLNANWRKNSFVSLFQRVQNLFSDLSTSLDGTLNEMVSYGSAANSRYCHLRSGKSTNEDLLYTNFVKTTN